MSNPDVKKIKEGTVTKVASGITSGVIAKNNKSPKNMVYYCTYRTAGGTAPTANQMQDEGFILFSGADQLAIKNDTPIDVYISCTNNDSDSADWGQVIIWT
jgi:hypothetical protein